MSTNLNDLTHGGGWNAAVCAANKEKITNLEKIVFGNGQNGIPVKLEAINGRLNRIEDKVKWSTKIHMIEIAALISGIIGLVLNLLFAGNS